MDISFMDQVGWEEMLSSEPSFPTPPSHSWLDHPCFPLTSSYPILDLRHSVHQQPGKQARINGRQSHCPHRSLSGGLRTMSVHPVTLSP